MQHKQSPIVVTVVVKNLHKLRLRTMDANEQLAETRKAYSVRALLNSECAKKDNL